MITLLTNGAECTVYRIKALVAAKNLNARCKRSYPIHIYLIMQKIHSSVKDRVDFWIQMISAIAYPLVRAKVVAQALTGVRIPGWSALS